MKIKFKSAVIALALSLVLQTQAGTLVGKVISVPDGDTITVLDDTETKHKMALRHDASEKLQALQRLQAEHGRYGRWSICVGRVG